MDYDEEYAERAGWNGDYNGEACEKCGRQRVMLCENGKRACEKCGWCPELGYHVKAATGN